jgi:hypothetical protein
VLNPADPTGKLLTDKTLTFEIPKDWRIDRAAAAKMKLWLVALPPEPSLESAERFITVGFEKKDPNVPALANLTNYTKANFDQAKSRAVISLDSSWLLVRNSTEFFSSRLCHSYA